MSWQFWSGTSLARVKTGTQLVWPGPCKYGEGVGSGATEAAGGQRMQDLWIESCCLGFKGSGWQVCSWLRAGERWWLPGELMCVHAGLAGLSPPAQEAGGRWRGTERLVRGRPVWPQAGGRAGQPGLPRGESLMQCPSWEFCLLSVGSSGGRTLDLVPVGRRGRPLSTRRAQPLPVLARALALLRRPTQMPLWSIYSPHDLSAPLRGPGGSRGGAGSLWSLVCGCLWSCVLVCGHAGVVSPRGCPGSWAQLPRRLVPS